VRRHLLYKAAKWPLRFSATLARKEDVKAATQIQQFTGAERRSSGSDAAEFVFLAKIGKRYGNRLLPPSVIQIKNALLAPVARAPNDIDLLSAGGQERMRNHRLCRR
jgi:hypothetical protein